MKGRTVTIRNCGSGVINWQASSDVEWLILNKYAGASTGKPENVAVFIKAADLAPGKHVGRVLFAAPGSWNSPQALTVTVFVQRPSPTIGPGSRPAGNLCLGGGIFCATLKFMRDKGGKYLILSPKDRETAIQMENNALIRRCAHRAPVGAEARVKWRTKMRQQAAKRVDAVRLGSPRGGPECG